MGKLAKRPPRGVVRKKTRRGSKAGYRSARKVRQLEWEAEDRVDERDSMIFPTAGFLGDPSFWEDVYEENTPGETGTLWTRAVERGEVEDFTAAKLPEYSSLDELMRTVLADAGGELDMETLCRRMGRNKQSILRVVKRCDDIRMERGTRWAPTTFHLVEPTSPIPREPKRTIKKETNHETTRTEGHGSRRRA